MSESRVELACFEIADQMVGIDVLHIREIVRNQETTPLPKAPSLIEGVIDLRGKVIPIVDLGRALAKGSCQAGAAARIAIVEIDELVFGLRVDAAVDVLSVASGSVEGPPALATHSGYDAVRAVVRRKDAPPVMVLALEEILESVYRSNPRSGEEAQ
ncbi:MAG: chemotaxis protein CheW [Deltaproteobacteria bacterium]|nr:chemotaxis protein CheW [Deltaproteobacteria bacterium]MBW2392990.1 chemotaxis protein CheW [Deltaproteobacteria bacterium]